jgi:hypothetical protein
MPDIVSDGQKLESIVDESYTRVRMDPPYNHRTASEMYNTKLPETSKLLTAGARVIKPESLMFLLLGPQNFQWHPLNTRRIGWIVCSIVPNNELRCLHIYYKE